MTVVFSKKCEVAIQAVLFLSAQDIGVLFNAKDIAERMKLPKEFVSKILQTLTSNGIIGSRKGKNGRFYLHKHPEKVFLVDIVEAIDGLDVFHRCILGFEGCTSSQPCPVHDEWGKLRELTLEMLKNHSLAEIKDKTISKIESL